MDDDSVLGFCTGCGHDITAWRAARAQDAERMESLMGEVASLRATNSRLNRRCQSAESGLKARIEGSEVKSFGRAFANAAATMFADERDDALAKLSALEREKEALKGLLERVEHALVANWPTDPHAHQLGGGHVCDAECEQEYHYACLVNDVRRASRSPQAQPSERESEQA